MNDINILILCGPSGQGKSFLENKLLECKNNKNLIFHKLIQVTTRDRRAEEIGLPPEKSYLFLTNKEYKELNDSCKLIGCMNIEDNKNNKYYYGTLFNIENLLENNKNNKSKIIYTIILNKDAIYDFYNKLDIINKKFKDISIHTQIYFIDGNSDIKRKGRNKSYVFNERKSLLNNFNSIISRKYFNNFKTKKFININKVIIDINNDFIMDKLLDDIMIL